MEGPARLRKYAKEKELTYRDIALLLGASKQTVSQWAAGMTRPKLEMRYVLETLIEADPSCWLTTEEKNWIREAQAAIRKIRRQRQHTEPTLGQRFAGRI
jgi:transcriptional regulator with XRE-family HTH domain